MPERKTLWWLRRGRRLFRHQQKERTPALNCSAPSRAARSRPYSPGSRSYAAGRSLGTAGGLTEVANLTLGESCWQPEVFPVSA